MASATTLRAESAMLIGSPRSGSAGERSAAAAMPLSQHVPSAPWMLHIAAAVIVGLLATGAFPPPMPRHRRSCIASAFLERTSAEILRAMGKETANIHSGSPDSL